MCESARVGMPDGKCSENVWKRGGGGVWTTVYILYSPVLATSQGSTIVSPVMNLNVSERDMNMGSFLVIMLWADTGNGRDGGRRYYFNMKCFLVFSYAI